MKKGKLEFWVGVFALLTIYAVVFIAFKSSNLAQSSSSEVYRITAYFNETGGLRSAAPVTIAGVRVGRVSSIQLDLTSFRARVEIDIEKRFNEIPLDSSVSVLTSGILGEKYLGLTPGGEEEFLEEGSEIEITQSAIVLENLISTFMDNMSK